MLVAAVALTIVVPAAHGLTASERTAAPAIRHVVGRGETLWAVARRARPGQDPRRVVRAVMRANGLRSPLVRPGQVLLVPAR